MIIFFYGEDSFRSYRKILEIKQKYLNSDKSGSGLSVFDCGENISSADENIAKKIINVAGTPNLLAPKRLLIVKNLIGSAIEDEQKKLLGYFEKNIKELKENQDTVIIFWEKNQPKKNNAFYKFLFSQIEKKQEFEKITGKKLEAWTLKTMSEIDPSAKIRRAALEKLIAYCSGDTCLLFSELKKLVSYANEKIIEEKDVDLLVRAKTDVNIFQMVDALGVGNKKEALNLLHNHLEKGDDPFYLLSMFFYQFRNMLKVADLKEQNMPEYEIARAIKLHPFVVKKSLSQVARFSLNRLKKIYQQLVDLDMKTKTGKIEIKLALDKFVAEL